MEGARVVELERSLLIYGLLPHRQLNLSQRCVGDRAQRRRNFFNWNAILQHLVQALVNETSVVELGSCLLHFDTHRVKTLLKNRFEMLLCQRDELVIDQVLFDHTFDDAPQGLDRVELRAIRRQKHELEVERFSQLCHFLGVVR